MPESERKLKSLLLKVKEESEKVGLKLSIQKIFMASGPITSWEIDGETVEKCQTLFFGASKITVDGDCSHEIKRLLVLGRKVLTNLDRILKSRDVTLPTKVCPVKAIGEGNGTPLQYSTLAWKIPWMEEPGRLQSMGSLRVRHD